MGKVTMGQADDMSSFMSAVIDANAFHRIHHYINLARASPDAEVAIGGKCDDSVGYFVEPTVIVANTTDFVTMKEEIFGPVLTVHKYSDEKFEEMLTVCD